VTHALPRAVDLARIPFAFDEPRTHSSFLLQPPLLRHDGALYGGTAIAASVMAMEAATDRDVQWITTQFVRPAQNGETIDLQADVLASGRRTAQVRVTATVGEAVVFTSIGSTGTRIDNGLTGQFERMPSIGGPGDATDSWQGHTRMGQIPDDPTFRRAVEYRHAPMPEGPGPVLMWARFTDDGPMTPAGLAFVADMVPVAIARGAGKLGAGTSLDNSMRFGAVPEVEWVLLELHGNLAAGGYGHGLVRVWAEDGTYLAIGSQTASMVYVFDDGDPPPFPTPTTS
jgi:acyl-CoA thioesterase II